MKEYTEMFEYATEVVTKFIDNEVIINEKDLSNLYGDNAYMSNFFNFNLNQLTVEEVRKVADNMFSQDGNEQRPYNPALARIRSLYVTLCASCGKQFIETLTGNIISGLCTMTSGDRKTVETFKDAFKKHPELIIPALGTHYFGQLRVKFNHRGSGSR